jgi:type III restriction enzyme
VPQVTIENPILNSAFAAPARHFKFDDEGITTEIEERRRTSTFFMPIARARKKGEQAHFDTEWTNDRMHPNTEINRIRDRIDRWRQGGYVDVTPTTRRLLAYWTNPARDKRLFFCQIEAVETAIYLAEVAARYGDAWIENYLRDRNQEYNAGLPRIAFKMATGSGKTVVMAC